MKTYNEVFKNLKNKNQGALIAFTVIGDPDFRTSLEIVNELIKSGADCLEFGLPFSDPIADGPTIQAANIRSINNGMNTKKSFDFIKEIRKFSEISIGLLTYYNLVYQFGVKKFLAQCKKNKVNSLLIADLPLEESHDILIANKKINLNLIFMVTQLTPDKRIKLISQESSGFIYAVSRLGVTGAKSDLQSSTLQLVKRIKRFTIKPICVGFGISKPKHVKEVLKAGADGVIIGSAIVKLIEKNLHDKEKMFKEIYTYVKSMKKSTQKPKNRNI